MQDWLGKLIIVALFAIVLGVPFLLRPAETRPSAAQAGDEGEGGKLVIISPHNEQIRFETATAFNDWRAAQGLPRVEFDWRSSGGTSDLRKQVIAEYEAEARRALAQNRPVGGVGYDLFFGGGDYDHGQLAVKRTVASGEGDDARTLTYYISTPADLVEPKELDALRDQWRDEAKAQALRGAALDAFLSKRQAEVHRRLQQAAIERIFPHATIGDRDDGSGGGEPLYYHVEGDEPLRWTGAVLSSFGIVYNRDVLAALGADPPHTWADLADPVFRNNIALADPSHSGSITEAYNAILMRVGWEEGWKLLRRAFANARYFTSTSSKVPMDVSAGEAAAGMCIDFYGRFQVGAVAGPDGTGRVGYADPPGLTKINADPISVMHGAPHDELAHQFVRWLLSKDGQQLWQTRLPTAAERSSGIESLPGGPTRFELRRQPIRRDMYHETDKAQWVDDVNPFEIARPRPLGVPSFFGSIATISHAMAIDVHSDLVAAWGAICECEDPALKADLLEQFDRMPDELTLTLPAPLYELRGKDIKGLPAAMRSELDAYLTKHLAKKDVYDVQLESMHMLSPAVVERIERHLRHPGYQAIVDPWSAEGDQQLRDRLRWTKFFRDNYRDIVRKAEGR